MTRRDLWKILFGILMIAGCIGAAFGVCIYQNPSTERPADYGESLGIQTCMLQCGDEDGDGVSDRKDILQGALDYVNTHPRYGSRYYSGGYPDDGYGVCTDLVASALLSAGFDLKELVASDVTSFPEEYDADAGDANIDYRRVRILQEYFARNFISASLDPTEASEWVGGDIVVFENHIGIVSDRRNARGISYVIHHAGEWQLAFEEDILENSSFGRIIGHYRVR